MLCAENARAIGSLVKLIVSPSRESACKCVRQDADIAAESAVAVGPMGFAVGDGRCPSCQRDYTDICPQVSGHGTCAVAESLLFARVGQRPAEVFVRLQGPTRATLGVRRLRFFLT